MTIFSIKVKPIEKKQEFMKLSSRNNYNVPILWLQKLYFLFISPELRTLES